MSLDLAYDDGQEAIRTALDQFCADHCDDATVKELTGRFPEDLWSQLCELGVLEAATPEGEGGALEVCAALEALGRWVVPGPWAASLLATQVLEGEERRAVAAGRRVVAAGRAGLMPWAPAASIFLELDGERVWRVRVDGPVAALETLGGEPWGRCRWQREVELEGAEPGYTYFDLAQAAYLAAAAQRLIEAAADHARTRVQFGKAIGEFQAVAHPLADCSMAVAASATLARAAAWRLDEGELAEARDLAAGARVSAHRSGIETVHVCHQVFGAVGITLEGPAYHLSRRIRQLVSTPPGEDAARERLLASIGMASTKGAAA